MLANDFQDILLNEKRCKSIYIVCRILNEKGNQNIKLYTHIMYYVYLCAYVFLTRTKALSTEQTLTNTVTHTEQTGTRWTQG